MADDILQTLSNGNGLHGVAIADLNEKELRLGARRLLHFLYTGVATGVEVTWNDTANYSKLQKDVCTIVANVHSGITKRLKTIGTSTPASGGTIAAD